MKIAYCGYDFFYSCFDDILGAGHEVVELFTFETDNEYDFNHKVIKIASDNDIPITKTPISVSDLSRLKDKGADLILSAAYLHKIPEWHDFVPYAVNIHPALLPIGRGCWPLPWIILKGLETTGVTLHEVSKRFDEGDIILQSEISVLSNETLETLSIRMQLTARDLLARFLKDHEALYKDKKPQIGGEYWPMPKAEDRTIDWNQDIETIDRMVRAFSKFETYCWIEDKKYYVRKADCWVEEHLYQPGTLVHETNLERVYTAKDGFVCLSDWRKAD